MLREDPFLWPSVVSHPELKDPASGRKRTGVVVLNVVINENGLPQDVQVMRSLGAVYDEEAVKNVKGWRFEPALSGGVPVSAAITIELNFGSTDPIPRR